MADKGYDVNYESDLLRRLYVTLLEGDRVAMILTEIELTEIVDALKNRDNKVARNLVEGARILQEKVFEALRGRKDGK